MAIKIGSISISLSAETASFNTEMGRASQMALSTSRQIERSFTIMAGAITAATGAAVSALGVLIERTEDTVFSMQKMAQQAGVTLEQFSKFAYIAKQAGMPVDQMAVILTRAGHSAFEAANGSKQAASAFKAFDVDVTNANGTFKTADQILLALAKSGDKFRDSSGKTGAEMTVLGRSGAQAAEFMHMLATRYDELGDKAVKLGVVLDGPTAQGAQKLHEGLVDLEEAALGFSIRLLSQVSPALEQLTQRIVAFASTKENVDKITQIGQDIANGIKIGADAIEFLINHFEALKVIIESLVAIRLGGMFIPMIASAAGASGAMGKLGIAALNMTGNLLGIRRLGNLLAPVGQGAATSASSFAALSSRLGVAGTSSLYFANAMAAVKESLLFTVGPAALAAAAVYEFTMALKSMHEYSEVKSETGASWWAVQKAEISEATDSVANFYDYVKMVAGLTSSTDESQFYTNVAQRLGAHPALQGGHNFTKVPGRPDDYETSTAANGSGASGTKDFPVTGDDKVDPLIVKLKELHDRAVAAHEALDTVGLGGQAARNVEIAKKYAEFLDEAMKAKRQLTQAEMDAAHADIATEVNDTAARSYREALLQLKTETISTTQEQLTMAAAVGKSARAMQDAIVAAETNKEMIKLTKDPSWANNPAYALESVPVSDNIRKGLNAANQRTDNQTVNSMQAQLDAQDALNTAIGKGAEARRQAELASQVAGITADFNSRPDTDNAAMQKQIDLVTKKSEADAQAAALERAEGLNVQQRYNDEIAAIQKASAAAKQYGVDIDQRQVLAANKEAWMQLMDAQDKAILATGSALDGLKVALDQMARDTESNAQRVHDIVSGLVGQMNDAMAKLFVTGNVKDFRKQTAGDFRGLGETLAKTGLQKAESSLFGGAFGKPDGSSSKPFSVKIVGGVGGLAGGVAQMTPSSLLKDLGTGGGNSANSAQLIADLGTGGGAGENSGGTTSGTTGSSGNWFTRILGIGTSIGSRLLQGAFADGGSVVSGVPALIGERGPELFVPPSSGSILPNSALSGLGRGHTINIDASGSQDPAQTQAMVMRGIAAAAPHIISGAVASVHDHAARRPSHG